MVDYFECVWDNDAIPGHIKETLSAEMHHALEVSNFAGMIARELKMADEICEKTMTAGILHDIGKLKLTRYIYSDDDRLLVEQMKYVRLHSALSKEILNDEGYPKEIAEAVYHHHENYDGSGYPDNLRGDDIPFISRILRTCDVFSALTSDRSYRRAFDEQAALEIMIDEVGDYDMEIFLAFQRVLHGEEYQGATKLREVYNEKQMEHLKLFEKVAMQYLR